MQFADLAIANVTPDHRFLDEMINTIPWDLFDTALKKKITRKTGGRPPYPLLLLFKMSLLQTWFGLSDAQTEFQCCDRLTFRRFLGLGIDDRIPEATTLENFRHDLIRTGLDVQLMRELDAYFKAKGILLKEGNMVDASFIQANSKQKKDSSTQSDIDAEYGNKGFGYSATANVDRKTKLIRCVNTTSERPHDSQQLEAVLLGDEKQVYGDTGYIGNVEMLKQRGIKARILKRRPRGKKGEPTPDLPLREQYMNKLKAKLRAPVEHVFACWKCVFGVRQTAYRGLERVNSQVQRLALAYNLRRWGYLCRG